MAKGEQVDNQVAAPAEPRTPNLHRAKRSLLESANGSMATAAAIGQENNLVEQNEKRIDLTPAGLLMEGVCTRLRRLFAPAWSIGVSVRLSTTQFYTRVSSGR